MTYMTAGTTAAFWRIEHKPVLCWNSSTGKWRRTPTSPETKTLCKSTRIWWKVVKHNIRHILKCWAEALKLKIFFQHSQLTEVSQIILSFGWVPVQQTPPRRVVLGNKSHSYAIGCAFSLLFVFFSCIIYSSAVPFFPEWLASLPWIQSMLTLAGLDRCCGVRHISTGQTGGVPKTPWLQSILGSFVKHNYSGSSGWLFQHQSADLPSLKSGTTALPAWKCNSTLTMAGFVHQKTRGK